MATSFLSKPHTALKADKSLAPKLTKHITDLSKESVEPFKLAEPATDPLEKSIRKTFQTGRPLKDGVSIVQCKTCKRPMVGSIAAPHIRVCVQKHKEKVQRKKEQKEANRKAREARDKEARAAEAEEAARALAEQDDDGEDDEEDSKRPTGSKKRKADGEGEKGPLKKKTKKELEALAAKDKKLAKPKGPVDVERQCGVPLPNNGFCARSLTCKSHPMGAKRAVPGRSKPYDILLQQYQKKNLAKQRQKLIDDNKEKEEDFVDPRGPLDSDEEKDLVVAALQRWKPQPAATHTPISVRKRYGFIRCHEMLGQALRGSGGQRGLLASTAAANAGGGPSANGSAISSTPVAATHEEAEATAAANTSAPQASEERRRSSVATQRPTPVQTGHGSRKPSIASQVGIGTPTAATPTVDARA